MTTTEAFLVEQDTFFAPCSNDAVDSLIAQYNRDMANIKIVSDFMSGDAGCGALHYFTEGNKKHSYRGYSETQFNVDWAIEALNAAYWARAMALTDVMNYMPQKRRDEWNKSITDMTTPTFEENTVRATITQLLLGREQFFAERVDGIFQQLSGDHVTNSPSGFNKRMILNYMFDSTDYVNRSRSGYINDLRSVVAKFMGRDDPDWTITYRTLDNMARDGKWNTLDGGAIRIRLYKKGTAHLEVHPDIAWRLNRVLASLYPSAIPSEFRTKPAAKPKEFNLMQKPLPFEVITILSSIYCTQGADNVFYFQHSNGDSQAKSEAAEVMKSIGGAQKSKYVFEFDYDPMPVVRHIIATGCIPDHKSHQFYATREFLGTTLVDLLDIGDEDECLEPEAGQGDLATYLPSDRTMCVEISPMHCKILESKGFKVHCGDFLAWESNAQYDRVVMNPPFSEGRWQAHLAAAAKRVKTGGRLGAILPASAKSKDLPGFECEYHGPYHDEFAGTGVSVVILIATKTS